MYGKSWNLNARYCRDAGREESHFQVVCLIRKFFVRIIFVWKHKLWLIPCHFAYLQNAYQAFYLPICKALGKTLCTKKLSHTLNYWTILMQIHVHMFGHFLNLLGPKYLKNSNFEIVALCTVSCRKFARTFIRAFPWILGHNPY